MRAAPFAAAAEDGAALSARLVSIFLLFIPSSKRRITAVCDPVVPAAHRSSDNRTFVLVLDGGASSAMGNILTNLQTILSGVLTGATSPHPYWFSQYVGVVFYDPSAAQQTSATITATTILDFVHQMAAAVSTPVQSNVCAKSSMTGLIQALTSPGIGYRDEVFVVTAASAIDWIKEGPALSLITKSHAYVSSTEAMYINRKVKDENCR